MFNKFGAQRTTVAACWFTFAYAAFIGLFRFFGSEGEPGSLRISVSLVAPFVVAALVALLASSSKRWIFVGVAGAGILPSAVVSLVLLPLWVPALVLLYCGFKELKLSSLLDQVVSVLVMVGIFGAMISLLVMRDPLEWRYGTTEQYSNNTITSTESLLSASILGAVLVVTLLALRYPPNSKKVASPAQGEEHSATSKADRKE